jgi:hypothetical protein
MISPKYDVNACKHADTRNTEKKGKVPETGERKILPPVCAAEVWNLALQKQINPRYFLSTITGRKKLYNGKTGIFHAL